MKAKLLALLLLAGSAVFASNFYFGVRVGSPAGYYVATPPPPPAVTYATPAPGPGFSWVGGYWYPYRGHYSWHAGHWARRPYAGARRVAPRYHGHHYYGGYWRR